MSGGLVLAAVCCIAFVIFVLLVALFWGRDSMPRSAIQSCLTRRNKALKSDTEDPPGNSNNKNGTSG